MSLQLRSANVLRRWNLTTAHHCIDGSPELSRGARSESTLLVQNASRFPSFRLSIHATYCVTIAGASPGKTKSALRYVKTAIFCTCGSNNWESVQDRWVHAVMGLASTELSFHSCNVLRDCHSGVPRANKK